MPQFIQGTVVGDNKKYKSGARVELQSISELDLETNVVTTYDKLKYRLVGEGQRMILIPESEMQLLEELQNAQFVEEDFFM
jgi:hypothetical protein